MFRSERLTLTHGFALPRPAAACLVLFTPEGERAWIPTWAPHFLYPEDGATEAGMVFTTEQDGATSVWTMTAHAPEVGHVAYVRVTPGLRVVAIDVTVRPVDADSCAVSVGYDLTGLSEAGNAAHAAFADGFVAVIDGWRDLILDHWRQAA